MANCRLMQVKSIAECSNGSILQYFRPSLSYHLPLRSLFCLFLSSRFTQVLLYQLTWNQSIHLSEASLTMRELAERSLIGTYLYS